MGRRALTRGVVIGGALASYNLLLRRRQLRWGATDDEVDGSLPGDDLISGADLTATRAISVRASAGGVWPWIAQLGQGRGGFYSYDFLENLFGCRMHSAERVIAEWQEIGVGDKVNLAPEVPLTVVVVEPGRALVLRGGVPIRDAPAPYDSTWAFVLRDHSDGATRLVVRERYRYTDWWARLVIEPTSVVSFLMTQKMLRSIRDHAEDRAWIKG